MSSVHELMAAMEQAIRSIQSRHKTQQHRPVSKSRRALWNVPRISPAQSEQHFRIVPCAIDRSIGRARYAVDMVAAALSVALLTPCWRLLLRADCTHRVLTEYSLLTVSPSNPSLAVSDHIRAEA